MPFFGRDPKDLAGPFRDNIELPTRDASQSNRRVAAAPTNVGSSNGSMNKNPALDPQIKKTQTRRRWAVLAMLFLGFLLFSGVLYKKPSVSSFTSFFQSNFDVEHSNLYLIVSGSSEGKGIDVRACRMLLSTSILGYPTPWVIDYVSGQSDTGRTLSFLEKNTEFADLVIITKDVWFQLRSDVLIQRFLDITAKANRAIGTKGNAGPLQYVLMASKDDAPNLDLMVGRSLDVQTVLRYASTNNMDLAAVYAKQQSEYAEQKDLSTSNLGLGLDREHSLLASVKELHTKYANGDADFVSSMPPFWTVAGFEATSMPNSTWHEVEVLSADDDKHAVPVAIEYDPNLSKEDLQGAWNTLWFHPHSRELLTQAAQRPRVPLAIAIDSAGDSQIERRYWDPSNPYRGERHIGMKHSDDNELHKWADMCGGDNEAKEIFGDEGGAWKEPSI